MELTSKQRAKLRSLANPLETILYIGKDGITEHTSKEVYDALEARELIKCAVQSNCPLSSKEAAAALSGQAHAQVVQCIGRRFVLYRESRRNKQIILS